MRKMRARRDGNICAGPAQAGQILALALIDYARNPVRLGFHLLSIDTHGPLELRIVTRELDVNIVDQRHSAAPVVSSRTGEMLGELAVAVNNRNAAVRQLERKRRAPDLKRSGISPECSFPSSWSSLSSSP